MLKKLYKQVIEFLCPAQFSLEKGLLELNLNLIRSALKRGAQINEPLPCGMLPLSFLLDRHSYHLSTGMKGTYRRFQELNHQNRCSQYRVVVEQILALGANANKKDQYGLNALSYLITFYPNMVSEEKKDNTQNLKASTTTLNPHSPSPPFASTIPAYMSPLLTWFPQTAMDILKWMDMFPKMHYIQWEEEIEDVFYQGTFEVQKNLIGIIKSYQKDPLDWSAPMVLKSDEVKDSNLNHAYQKPNLVNPILAEHGRCFTLAELGNWDEIWRHENWDIKVRNHLTGHSLLHLASLEYPPHLKTVEILLGKGVDPSLKNHCGHTAKDLIVAQSSHEVEFLLDAHTLNEVIPSRVKEHLPKRL